MPKKPSFVDPNKDPSHYISRYYKEKQYKEWFDRNYPNLTIEEAVGLGKEKPKSKFGPEKIFVIVMIGLVIFAFFFLAKPDTLLGSVIHDFSPPDWDEVIPRHIVKQSIPITFLEKNGENCLVKADKFDIIIGHQYFVRGGDLAAELNFDNEEDTLEIKCYTHLLFEGKSRLVIWYAVEESPLHSKKFEYWVIPWEDEIKTTETSMISPQDGDVDTIVISPVFTAIAYSEGGFYEYHNGTCDESCLTMTIPDVITPKFRSSSYNGFLMLTEEMGLPYITDINLDQNPEYISNFENVILLHNEYVTAKEFEAITNHPNVIYLYPNALYAEVAVDYEQNTITLIRGHGFPSPEIANGFDWEFDNTHPYEYYGCETWEFFEIDNGKMLNCYPEKIIVDDPDFRKAIMDLYLH